MSNALLPLVPLYAAAAAAKNLAYDRGWLPARRLRDPVISIGNISVGGSGKTPLTIRMAQLLSERGIPVDVLSRGYGRRSATVERVDPAGVAEEFGDEPLLTAQSTGVPVYVGASRYDAGTLAESDRPSPGLHLLDDGFQHRGLARDLDIVVLHRSDFSSHLLPAGRLREGFSSLRRAQILVLREDDRRFESDLRRRGLQQPLWWTIRQLRVPPVGRSVAFCSIARPNEFFSALRSQGVLVEATRAWFDHHRFSSGNIAELLAAQRKSKAEAFVTTEKDLARLDAGQRRELESAAPLYAAKLVVTLQDEAACMDQVLAVLPVLPRRRADDSPQSP